MRNGVQRAADGIMIKDRTWTEMVSADLRYGTNASIKGLAGSARKASKLQSSACTYFPVKKA
jgi:hypothetical protein